MTKWIILIVVIIVILVLIYNVMLKKRNKVKTAFSSMDVMLKKRYDVMPNLVSMVKKYMEHESALLTALTELREKAVKTEDINESIDLNNQIEDALRKINVSVEAYPDLKASDNFLQMQNTLNEIEDQIASARRTYNAHCEVYNTFIGMIPLNIFALLFGFKEFKQFEIPAEERESKTWM